MKVPQEKTRLVIFVGLIVLGFWDLGCLVFEAKDFWTVSQVMTHVGMTSPFVVFIAGMCIGHFWFKSGIDT